MAEKEDNVQILELCMKIYSEVCNQRKEIKEVKRLKERVERIEKHLKIA